MLQARYENLGQDSDKLVLICPDRDKCEVVRHWMSDFTKSFDAQKQKPQEEHKSTKKKKLEKLHCFQKFQFYIPCDDGRLDALLTDSVIVVALRDYGASHSSLSSFSLYVVLKHRPSLTVKDLYTSIRISLATSSNGATTSSLPTFLRI